MVVSFGEVCLCLRFRQAVVVCRVFILGMNKRKCRGASAPAHARETWIQKRKRKKVTAKLSPMLLLPGCDETGQFSAIQLPSRPRRMRPRLGWTGHSPDMSSHAVCSSFVCLQLQLLARGLHGAFRLF